MSGGEVIKRVSFGKLFAGVVLTLALMLFFASTAMATQSQESYSVKLGGALRLMNDDSSAKSGWVTVSKQQLEKMLLTGRVLKYEPDYTLELHDYFEDDSYYQNMWEPQAMKSEAAWNMGFLGAQINVAVIDSGVTNHPELFGRVVNSKSYVEGAVDVYDTIGHGTSVAGVIAANRGNGIGYTGVAPRCRLTVLQVTRKLDDGTEVKPLISMIEQAIYDAVDVYNCRVINMSLGTDKDSERLREAVAYARSKGVVLIASSGNYGGTTPYYPASYDGVISVGAVDRYSAIWQSSQHNAFVDIVAPGVRVNVLSGDSGYKTWTGTSFSAPMVSGACAALLSANPTLTAEQIYDILTETAVDGGEPGYDEYFGHGILNFEAAAKRAVADCDIYISQIDHEDDQKRVYISNINSEDEELVFYIRQAGAMNKATLRIASGESLRVALGEIADTVQDMFVAKNGNELYSISRSAYDYHVLPATSAGIDAAVSFGEDYIKIIGGFAIPSGQRCNIRVVVAGKEVLARQFMGDNRQLEMTVPVALEQLDGYATRQGIEARVEVWGDRRTAAVASCVQNICRCFDDSDRIVELRRAVAGISPEGGDVIDYDGDGQCTSEDVVILRKIVAGLLPRRLE